MKKTFYKVFTLLMVLCLLTTAFCGVSLAASASVHFSDPSATVGSNVSVSVSIGSSVSMYDVYLSYNSSMLEYVSSTGSGNFSGQGGGGSIHINDYVGSGSGSFSCTLTFKALQSGSARIDVSSTDIVDANGDAMSVSNGYSLVTISNPATASSDANLKSLSISPGTLSPSFSSGTTSYTVTVPSGTTSVAVSASKNHSAASVSVSGTNNLSVGKNNVTVTVTAEDGTKKTYTIVVTRTASTINPSDDTTEQPADEDTEEPETPKDAYAMLQTGETMKVATEIPPEIIPAGFAVTETTVEAVTVPAIKYGDTEMVYVYLEGTEEIPAGFYSVDSATGLASPMKTFTQSTATLILADINTATAPAGYKLGKFTIGQEEYDAFIPEEAGAYEHCLVYAINSAGECVLYAYDPVDGYFQRYGLTDVTVAEPEPEEEEPVTEPEPVTNKDESLLSMITGNKVVMWTAIAAAAVIVILAALAIMLGIMYSRKSKACRIMASSRAHAMEIPDEMSLDTEE